MEYHMRCPVPPPARPLGRAFSGTGPGGRSVSFDTNGLLLDGVPMFAVCGEAHYARLDPSRRREALYKIKAGGVNIVSTYIFWIHHEERRGVFDWSGRRSLRAFLLDCAEVGLPCIVRVGPFNHGEVRNGGLPDWLYGMPFEVRSTDPGFLYYVMRLFGQIALQAKGLLFGDGGPVVGIQLDNEYMHSAAMWEATRATTREYASSSNEGDAYLLALKEICLSVGLAVPFYTCTAWGGAAAPYRECLPLWGGYPYMPWMIDDMHREHPLSLEYLYRDCKSPDCRRYHSYDPAYDPREMPFACCEMGPGMQVAYQYRFAADPRCADALSNVKTGSGCNFVGYYMYCGGTNPIGAVTPFLQEEWCPPLSYDYQAPLGEFLQTRESYRRLRALHGTLRTFEGLLARAGVALPSGTEDLTAADNRSLRAAVRSDGQECLLFLNNFQDHAPISDKEGIRITLKTEGDTFTIPRPGLPALSLAAGESCVLPAGIRILGAVIRYASVQILYKVCAANETTLFCMRPDGMRGEIDLGGYGFLTFSGEEFEEQSIALPEGSLTVLVFSRREAMKLSLQEIGGRKHVLYTGAAAYADNSGIVLECGLPEAELRVFPPVMVSGGSNQPDGRFSLHRVSAAPVSLNVGVRVLSDTRCCLTLPPMPEALADALLTIGYEGDTAQLFDNGRRLADNFCNGMPWETSLRALELPGGGDITLHIVPRKEGVAVTRDAMAAMSETVTVAHAKLAAAHIVPVYSFKLEIISQEA
jgi:hypothetical protein